MKSSCSSIGSFSRTEYSAVVDRRVSDWVPLSWVAASRSVLNGITGCFALSRR